MYAKNPNQGHIIKSVANVMVSSHKRSDAYVRYKNTVTLVKNFIVTPTDRPKSVRNRSVIELFCGVVCVVIMPY